MTLKRCPHHRNWQSRRQQGQSPDCRGRNTPPACQQDQNTQCGHAADHLLIIQSHLETLKNLNEIKE